VTRVEAHAVIGRRRARERGGRHDAAQQLLQHLNALRLSHLEAGQPQQLQARLWGGVCGALQVCLCARET
jgi:hypothetical protein